MHRSKRARTERKDGGWSTSLITLVGMASLGGLLLAGPALAQDLERGEALWALCTQCHGAEGQGNIEYLAPDIAGMPTWYGERQIHKFRDGLRGTEFDDIAGMRMRPMALSLRTDQDVADVSAFLATLPTHDPEPLLEGGDPEKGKQYYATCSACHGQNGEGNEQLGSPPLRGSSDWYLKTQLSNFKAGVRGANPNDGLGAQMRGMSYTLPDDQAILDVIAYIETLKDS
jgi:cytochrome c oxidase subunit 2